MILGLTYMTENVNSRDSDEASHQSESPSPVDGVGRIARGLMSEASSDHSQAQLTGSSARFPGHSHQYSAQGAQQHHHLDAPHSSVTSGLGVHSSREYFVHSMDQNSSSSTSSGQWSPSPYFQYGSSPPTESSLHDVYSSNPSLHSASLQGNRWEMGGLSMPHIREGFSPNPRERDERVSLDHSIATMSLSHSPEAVSTASIRPRESIRSRSGSTGWTWEEQRCVRIPFQFAGFISPSLSKPTPTGRSSYPPPIPRSGTMTQRAT
ncbi:hypothetical protein BDY19DRAFT_763745 [Irpex rosettiformis]|uniref:Uncharacterized protein n=1 Tax=Irpex rosettiformis TaxID=378272 RepID=A0ACB8U7J1_9APHY|nr:hypothetical protein BDY19DRAFT_763745 [Irpex rosettiformis]